MKKIVIFLSTVLLLSMITIPLALALPWDEKKNEKFETFSVSLTPNMANIMAAMANPEYIPSMDNPNKVVYTWVEEPMDAYTITVGGTSYNLG
ncbi:MAG: hypothetical protein P8X84_05650, partial [Candidatus Bathyarchaeota archaeon]